MNNQELNEYIKTVVKFSFDANKYFNDSEPWAIKKKDPERMNAIIFTIINISKENIKIDKIKDANILNNEKEIGDLDILFTKIEDDN